MKKLMIAALAAGQLSTATATAAAELDRHAEPRIGAFGGVRIRLPLDGERRDRQLRAGLAIAPTIHSRTADGETRLRIGEGLEFGVRARAPARLSLAGQQMGRLGVQGEEDDGGVPTWALVVGAGVIVLGAALLVFTEAMNASSE